MARFYLFLLAILVVTSGCSREISGKYIGKYTNGFWWLQLVRTPDDHLTGQLETSILQPDGRIERENVPITGAVNGSNVTLSVKQLGLEVLALSGTIDRSGLTLTGGQPSPMVLVRSDLSEYKQQVQAVNARAQKIVAERQAAAIRQSYEQALNAFLGSADQLIGKMQKFTGEADVLLGKFPAVENRYREITAKIAEYVKRERSLSGNANAGVARTQLVVAANQGPIAARELYNEVQSLQSSFDNNIKPLTVEISKFETTCRDALPNGFTASQVAARDTACERLNQLSAPFRNKFEKTAQGLLHLDQTYQQEEENQNRLMEQAARLQ